MLEKDTVRSCWLNDIIGESFDKILTDIQVLTNGIEVKLQRNALSVLEAPTGNEEDDYLEFEQDQWNNSDIGKLLFIIDSI